ncbi:MAG: 50S ribosomal protein L9 [Coriobacteriales bacterium]|jgi:large subunit ribosomal protein L9|nr:50S ribosomal protein L9 [Coriobacteriales bacterium]
MKIILLEELKGRGGEGDIIDVATGYAVNYLLPRKIAIPATTGNLKQLGLRKHNIAKRETNRLDTAEKLVAALEGKRVRIGAKVGEEGQLFGSVTPIQVAAAINEKFNVEVDRKRVDLHGLIKTAGDHEVTVSIYRDVKATLTIEVVDESALLAAAEAAAAAKAATEATVQVAEAAEASAAAETAVAEEVEEVAGDTAAEVVEDATAAEEAAEAEEATGDTEVDGTDDAK